MKTVFVDTNYFLRFLLKDNKQFQKVYDLFNKSVNAELKLVTSTIVFFEIYWVLSSIYKQNKTQLINYLRKILSLNFILIENKEILYEALSHFKKYTIDLEDCFNIAFYQRYKINQFSSFDQKVNRILKKI